MHAVGGSEQLLADLGELHAAAVADEQFDPKFVFEKFYDGLKDRGFVIYPGKLTVADSFRIGCIGRIGETEMRAFLAAAKEVMNGLGVTSGRPGKKAAE